MNLKPLLPIVYLLRRLATRLECAILGRGILGQRPAVVDEEAVEAYYSEGGEG